MSVKRFISSAALSFFVAAGISLAGPEKRPVISTAITINLMDTITRTTGIGTITDPIFMGMGTGIIPIPGRADTIVRLQASIPRAITSR